MKEALHWGVVVAGVTAHQNDRPVGLGTEITISAWMKARRPNDQSRDHRQYLEPVEAAGTFGTHKVALPLGRVPDNDDNHLRKIPSAPHKARPRLQLSKGGAFCRRSSTRPHHMDLAGYLYFAAETHTLPLFDSRCTF